MTFHNSYITLHSKKSISSPKVPDSKGTTDKVFNLNNNFLPVSFSSDRAFRRKIIRGKPIAFYKDVAPPRTIASQMPIIIKYTPIVFSDLHPP